MSVDFVLFFLHDVWPQGWGARRELPAAPGQHGGHHQERAERQKCLHATNRTEMARRCFTALPPNPHAPNGIAQYCPKNRRDFVQSIGQGARLISPPAWAQHERAGGTACRGHGREGAGVQSRACAASRTCSCGLQACGVGRPAASTMRRWSRRGTWRRQGMAPSTTTSCWSSLGARPSSRSWWLASRG